MKTRFVNVSIAALATLGLVNSSLSAPPNYPADWGQDYLSSSAGSQVIASSTMVGGDFAAARLIDGDVNAEGPFCVWDFTRKPVFVVIQLASEVAVGRVAFINAGPPDWNYHVKEVTLEASLNQQVWVPLGTFTLEKRAGLQSFAFEKPNPARFLRLTVLSNYGDANAAFLSEMAVFGKQKPPMTNEEYGRFIADLLKNGPPAIDIKCRYRFYNIEDQEYIKFIRQTLRYNARNGAVDNETTGQDERGKFTEFSLVVRGVRKLADLSAVLPFQKRKVGDAESVSIVFEEFDPQYSTNFRTVSITGSLRILVRFRITPKATLYYSVQPDRELLVPENQIDKDGNVELQVQIPRTQEYVYARTVMGTVERYLRINVETGRAEEIQRELYLKR